MIVDITWYIGAIKLIYIGNDSASRNRFVTATTKMSYKNLFMLRNLKEHFAFYTF